MSSSTATYRRSDTIYAQGDPCAAVLYVRHGRVCLSVVSQTGREATVAVLGPGNFFGQATLAGQAIRMGSATAKTACIILSIEATELRERLHEGHALSDRFISQFLARNLSVERDLLDHLFNGAEKRLARALLLLAHYGEQDSPGRVIPPISEKKLAEMTGTTRDRVHFFMNQFRERRFIAGSGPFTIHSSLLRVVLAD